MDTVFLGKHMQQIRFSIGDLKNVHRSVTDITEHGAAFKFTEFFGNCRKALRKHIGTDNAMRIYKRVEKLSDVDVTEFDGEGLISFQYAKKIDTLFCGEDVHTSFQVRMPYIKGVLHKVDFKSFLAEMGVSQIKDMWGCLS